MDILAEIVIPSWPELIQLGGMSGIAFALVWQMIRQHAIQARGLRSIAVTIITHQQMLLLLTSRGTREDTSDECKRLSLVLEDVKQAIERQRQDLEKVDRDG